MFGKLHQLKNTINLRRKLRLLPLLALTGCLEVEDNNHSQEVANAIREQNRLYEEQQNTSVMLYGEVHNLESNDLAEGISIRLKVGPNWMEAVNFDSGSFELSDIKPSSNFEMIISSPSGKFLDRTLYGSTNYSSTNNAFQELPFIEVSPGVVREFAVTNSETEEPIANLEFIARSHIGSGSSYKEYQHVSSYDSETGRYSITLPEHLQLTVNAELDFDDDNEADYTDYEFGGLYGTQWRFSTVDLESETSFSLTSNEPDILDVTLRISVLDQSATARSGIELLIDDELNGVLSPIYDEENNQYVFTAKLENALQVLIGTFVDDDGENYKSSYLSIRKDQEENSFNISTSNTYSDQYYRVINEDLNFNLAVAPIAASTQSSLQLIFKTEELGPLNPVAKFFYSSPIEFEDGDVALYKKNHLEIIRGNDSETDLVLPGTTYISFTDLEIPSSKLLSLGGTLLTIEPNETLENGASYEYLVERVVDVTTGGEYSDSYSNRLGFDVPVATVFDISEIQLDNNNYWSNGSLIKPVSTANEPNNSEPRNQSVSIYMPTSVATLRNFELSKRIVTYNGVQENRFNNYLIVEDGVVRRSLVPSVSVAQNEVVEVDNYSFYSIQRGANLADKFWYRLELGEYMADHTVANTNEILLEYSYETQDGELSTGQITLQVR